MDSIQSKIDEINASHGDSIIAVFSIPIGAIVGYTDYNSNVWTLTWIINHINSFGDWISSFTSPANSNEIYYPESVSREFEGYTPKNKKLLHYPYRYIGFNPPNRYSKNI